MSYQPNFGDPRVTKRIRGALGFALGVLSVDKPRGWSATYLNRQIGRTNEPLGRYLRSLLVICVDEYYSADKKITMKYQLNGVGASYLRHVLRDGYRKSYQEYLSISQVVVDQKLTTNTYVSDKSMVEQKTTTLNTYVYDKSDIQDNFDYSVVKEWVIREYGRELQTNEFTYQDKSSRLWHPIQNIRSELRGQILADNGYLYDYDISCAAPTLLYQHAQQGGLTQHLGAINLYITDKQQVRDELSWQLGMPVSMVKVMLNALFSGAKLGYSPRFDMTRILGGDYALVERVKNNEYVSKLRAELPVMWRAIETTMTIRRNSETNKKLPLRSRDKWARYFELERQVLNSVRAYLKSTGNDCFLIHDGWTTRNPIDIPALVEWVYNNTGFNIKLEEMI